MATIFNDIGPNASQALINAAEAGLQPPSSDVFRVTSVIDAPLIRTLKILHWDELKIPLSKCISALHGTAWHMLMEKHAPKKSVVEDNVSIECPGHGDWIISGTPDEYDPSKEGFEEIRDHKTCKVWKYVSRDFSSWEQQLNIYALLKRLQGLLVNRLSVHAAFTDWSKYARMQGGDSYPSRRALKINIPLWTKEKQAEYLIERMNDHLLNPTRECTMKEKWQKETTYALKKKGLKKALKVEPSIESLHTWNNKKKKPLDIHSDIYSFETRKGSCVRCDEWCEVSQYCPHYMESL